MIRPCGQVRASGAGVELPLAAAAATLPRPSLQHLDRALGTDACDERLIHPRRDPDHPLVPSGEGGCHGVARHLAVREDEGLDPRSEKDLALSALATEPTILREQDPATLADDGQPLLVRSADVEVVVV
jgi:hypothetical protein